MAYRTSDNIFPSLASISADKVIELCKIKKSSLEEAKKEEVEELIMEHMKPKKFLFWTLNTSREKAIIAINKRESIGVVSDIELDSLKDKIDNKYLNKINNVNQILKVAEFAKENSENTIFLNFKDCQLLSL